MVEMSFASVVSEEREETSLADASVADDDKLELFGRTHALTTIRIFTQNDNKHIPMTKKTINEKTVAHALLRWKQN